ncbi:MAG: M3 family oligoendopeptidase [Bacteroidetes bacterium]|nr:MAG: M3 family oligoendopeptidase [Bacteroidota bacterium]REK06547.1 MAG: M3 family oligoendopeptidase [Bacteroidota bacterium]REK33313.1 MAG: M3 family oligoendopeptidase [Bacteroidota bacterium]REK49713.1 MAG: M3 family oligoendopeptidase [Bacteroidota bacterium]
MQKELQLPEKIRRKFVPENLNLDSWESLEPFYKELTELTIDSIQELNEWLAKVSELESVVQEHIGWLYIRMTCDTKDQEKTRAYTYFVENIHPKIEPYADKLNKKLFNCSFKESLDKKYELVLKQVENSIRIFREENIPLVSEMTLLEQKYGEIAGAMSIEWEGKTLTLQQAARFIRNPDREIRRKAYELISARRLQDREKLDELFDNLIALRDKVSHNSDFENYRDYKFVELDRFDYSADDCLKFHESVKGSLVPILEKISAERKSAMKLESLKPWDTEVDVYGREDLKPFDGGKELMDKTIACFNSIDPYFAEVASTLNAMNFIDLDSRVGKAPGGYNYPLYESGVPFIFMNASGSFRDVVTMVHEGGHAIHSMLTRELEYVGFKELPSEIAELASMGMELISMEHWEHFFANPEELKRARKEQLENVLEALPWIACIDHFQHWLYTNPGHTQEDRNNAWLKMYSEFNGSSVDWKGHEKALEAMWQKQLHLYEVPFYYIEYGMAQLGAIALWRNYKKDPAKTLKQYKEALSLGYTCSIPEVYKTAGIRFDFSADYIRELADFTYAEYLKV